MLKEFKLYKEIKLNKFGESDSFIYGELPEEYAKIEDHSPFIYTASLGANTYCQYVFTVEKGVIIRHGIVQNSVVDFLTKKDIQDQASKQAHQSVFIGMVNEAFSISPRQTLERTDRIHSILRFIKP